MKKNGHVAIKNMHNFPPKITDAKYYLSFTMTSEDKEDKEQYMYDINHDFIDNILAFYQDPSDCVHTQEFKYTMALMNSCGEEILNSLASQTTYLRGLIKLMSALKQSRQIPNELNCALHDAPTLLRNTLNNLMSFTVNLLHDVQVVTMDEYAVSHTRFDITDEVFEKYNMKYEELSASLGQLMRDLYDLRTARSIEEKAAILRQILLISSSSLSEDIYHRVLHPPFPSVSKYDFAEQTKCRSDGSPDTFTPDSMDESSISLPTSSSDSLSYVDDDLTELLQNTK